MLVRNISLCIGIFFSLPLFAGEWWHVYFLLNHCNKTILRSSTKAHARLAAINEKAMKDQWLTHYSMNSKHLFSGVPVLTTLEGQSERMKVICAIQPDIGTVKIDVLSDSHAFDREKVGAEAKKQFEAGTIQQCTSYHELE
jgi:hypothetical protein